MAGIHRKPKPRKNEEKAGYQGVDQQIAAENDCAKYGHTWSYSQPQWCTSCGKEKK